MASCEQPVDAFEFLDAHGDFALDLRLVRVALAERAHLFEEGLPLLDLAGDGIGQLLRLVALGQARRRRGCNGFGQHARWRCIAIGEPVLQPLLLHVARLLRRPVRWQWCRLILRVVRPHVPCHADGLRWLAQLWHQIDGRWTLATISHGTGHRYRPPTRMRLEATPCRRLGLRWRGWWLASVALGKGGLALAVQFAVVVAGLTGGVIAAEASQGTHHARLVRVDIRRPHLAVHCA
mmetsp:Transcript_19100/g.49308  ORF Transcript_19100/g.49308 Transcript_19100/m.49308 type:complete len:236 (+) Transcript_19100:57-764(+)